MLLMQLASLGLFSNQRFLFILAIFLIVFAVAQFVKLAWTKAHLPSTLSREMYVFHEVGSSSLHLNVLPSSAGEYVAL